MKQCTIDRAFLSLIFMMIGLSVLGQFRVTPENLSFGHQSQIDTQIVTIQNILPFDLLITDVITFNDEDSKHFAVGKKIHRIPPYKKIELEVYFKPTQNKVYDEVIVFKTLDRGDFALKVSGRGEGVNAEVGTSLLFTSRAEDIAKKEKPFYVSSDSVVFRNLVSLDSLIHHVVIYNTSSEDLVLQSFDQELTEDFKILNPPKGKLIKPGEFYDVRIFLEKPFSGYYPVLLRTNQGYGNVTVQTGPPHALDEWLVSNITSFPNPTIDHIKLYAPIPENLSYQVIDAMGNIIYNGTFRNSVSIDTRWLRWGNYNLSVSRYSKVFVQPIVKTNR